MHYLSIFSFRSGLVAILFACARLMAQGQTNFPASVVGEWTNNDFDTRSVTRFTIRLEGTNIMVHMWGRCSPKECDWREQTATMAGQTLHLTWPQTGAVLTQVLKIMPDGTIEMTGHCHITDKQKRMGFRGVTEDYDIKGIFEKGLVHDWSTPPAKKKTPRKATT